MERGTGVSIFDALKTANVKYAGHTGNVNDRHKFQYQVITVLYQCIVRYIIDLYRRRENTTTLRIRVETETRLFEAHEVV